MLVLLLEIFNQIIGYYGFVFKHKRFKFKS